MNDTLTIHPYSRVQGNNTLHYADLWVNGKKFRTLTGFSSVREAREETQKLADRYLAGEITLEDIRTLNARAKKVQGRTLREWAEHFNVSPQALSKAAKNKGLTLEQEILKRLPIHEHWEP